jgi:threonine dehydrogenase-like Zn-dependent dehydrogenase
MDLMLRYYEQMPFESFVTHRFSLDEAQQAIDTALDWNQCMKVVFEPTFREG